MHLHAFARTWSKMRTFATPWVSQHAIPVTIWVLTITSKFPVLKPAHNLNPEATATRTFEHVSQWRDGCFSAVWPFAVFLWTWRWHPLSSPQSFSCCCQSLHMDLLLPRPRVFVQKATSATSQFYFHVTRIQAQVKSAANLVVAKQTQHGLLILCVLLIYVYTYT